MVRVVDLAAEAERLAVDHRTGEQLLKGVLCLSICLYCTVLYRICRVSLTGTFGTCTFPSLAPSPSRCIRGREHDLSEEIKKKSAFLATKCNREIGAEISVALTLVFHKAEVCQLLAAHLAGEALWVPGGVHGLDHPPDDELAALGTARGKEDVEAVLAVLALLKLIKDAIRERAEALGASAKRLQKLN